MVLSPQGEADSTGKESSCCIHAMFIEGFLELDARLGAGDAEIKNTVPAPKDLKVLWGDRGVTGYKTTW